MPVYKVFVSIIDKEFIIEGETPEEAGKSVYTLLSDDEKARLMDKFVYMGFDEVKSEELD